MSYKNRSNRFSILCVCVLGMLSDIQAEDQMARPNILYIFSDDHALQAISAYKNSRFADYFDTPNIDRIAEEGAVFERSYCANSICGPSRASVLTGKHSVKNGFVDNLCRFNGEQPTLPKYLLNAGYQTAIIGKWHLHSVPIGFNHWEILPGQGNYYNPDFIQMDGTTKREEGYVTDLITDKTLEWLISERDKDKPFFLMCQNKAPHRSWFPAERHYMMFDGINLPEPETLFDDYAGRSVALRQQKMRIADHFYAGWDMMFHEKTPQAAGMQNGLSSAEYARMTDLQKRSCDLIYQPRNKQFLADLAAGRLSETEVVRWKYQRYIKNYLRCVRSLDENIGRLLDYLDEAGLAENTIVVYSSDQGFFLGEHGWYDKRWMLEESFAMPFLIRWPGVVKAGIRSQALIQNIDHAPTFLEAAGLEIPDDIDGFSLLPLFRNDGLATADWRKMLYYFYRDPRSHNVAVHDGIATRRYKLFYLPQTDEWQLFDLREDPHEMRSLQNHAEYSGVFAEMKTLYQDARALYGPVDEPQVRSSP